MGLENLAGFCLSTRVPRHSAGGVGLWVCTCSKSGYAYEYTNQDCESENTVAILKYLTNVSAG